jgi:hypothetical protein
MKLFTVANTLLAHIILYFMFLSIDLLIVAFSGFFY